MSTSSFFKEHEEVLKKYYPGINSHIFNRFCTDLQAQKIEFSTIKTDLLKGKPLEYILGLAHFYSIDLVVNENVLIPRFETEILFDLTLKEINKRDNPRVIDIGCGPGTIILTLMKEANKFEAFASDISSKAIELAKINFSKNRELLITKDIQFTISDRFKSIEDQFDIIVSNPPYIKKESDKNTVHISVQAFEPEVALYLPDEEYESWFEEFFKQAYNKLNLGGVFLIESHEDHLTAQKIQALNTGFSQVEIINDLTNRPRFLKMEKHNG